jgi:hypothetical protein
MVHHIIETQLNIIFLMNALSVERMSFRLCIWTSVPFNILRRLQPSTLFLWRVGAGRMLQAMKALVVDCVVSLSSCCAGIDQYPSCFSTQHFVDLTCLVMASFASGQDGFEGNETLLPCMRPCHHTTGVLLSLILSLPFLLTPVTSRMIYHPHIIIPV